MILPPLNFRSFKMLVATALLVAGPNSSPAATYTWRGGGADNSWTTAANWQGNSAPPSGNLTDLIFGNTGFDDSTLGGAFGVHSLNFTSDASVYHFSNGPLALGAGGLDEESANAQVFNVTVALATDQTWHLASGAGQLNFFNGINTSDTGGAGHVLTVNANTVGSDGNAIMGDIRGNGSLVKTGAGTLSLAGEETYTGATTVNAGALLLGGGGGTISNTSAVTVNAGGTLTVNGLGQLKGAGMAAMHLTGTATSLATLNIGVVQASTLLDSASVTLPGNAYLDTNVRVNQTGGTFKSANLTLGSTGGNNIYALSGTGSVTTGTLAVGDSGSGTFNQFGGTVTATSLTLGGGRGTASPGVYNLDAGTLAAGSITGNSRNGVPQGVLNFHGGTLQATASSTDFLANVVANVRGSTDASGVPSGGAIIEVGSVRIILAQPLLHSPVAGDAAIDGGLTILGGGNISLTANNTYTGPTTISAGTLSVGNQGTTGSLGAGPVINNGALVFDRSDSITVSNPIRGSGSLMVGESTETVTLAGASSYTGQTVVSQGKLVVGTGGSIASGGVIVNPGATLAIQGNGSVSTVNDSLFQIDGQDTLSGQGKVSLSGGASIGFYGSGTLTQSGGSLTTNGNYLYLGYLGGAIGKYSLSGGTLSTGVTAIGFAGSGSFVHSGGSFTTNGNQFVVGYSVNSNSAYNLSGTGSLSTGPAYIGSQGTGTFVQSGGSFTTNNNVLDLAGSGYGTGSFTLSGTGSLFTGTTRIGALGTGTFTQSGGTHTTGGLYLAGGVNAAVGIYNLEGGVLNTGSIATSNYGFPNFGTSTFNFNGGTLQPSANNASYFSGLTTANVRADGAIIDTNGFDVTIAQPLLHSTIGGDNATDGGLVKNGVGTLTLTGANSFTGGVGFNGGTVNVGSLGALGSTGALRFGGGTLQYSAANTTDYSSRFSTGSLQNFSIDTNGQNVTFATGLAGNGNSLAKLGLGTLILTGTNSFAGGIAISRGILNVGSAGALGATGTISFGGTLQYSSANHTDYSNRFSTADYQFVNIDTNGQNVTFATGVTTPNSGLLKVGAGTLTLTGTNTYRASTQINGGTLELATGGSVTDGYVLVAAGATFNVTGGTVGTSGGGFELGTTPGLATANLSSGTFNSILGYIGDVTGSTAVFNQTGGHSNTGMYVGGASGSHGAYNLSGGTQTAPAFVGYSGTGTFTQTGGTMSGGVAVGFNAGGNGLYTLNAGNLSGGILIGEYGTGTFTQNGGSVAIGDLVVGSSVGGIGTYNLNGGTISLNTGRGDGGTATFNFNGGTLQAAANRTNFFQEFTTANVKTGGAVIDTNGFDVTIGQTLLHDTASGAPVIDGGLTKQGAGSLRLAALNTYTGTTTVDGGTLVIIVNGALGESDVTIEADATLNLGVGVTAAHNADAGTTLTLASANTSIVGLAGSGVQDVVGTLVISGVRMAAGTYGAPGSGAMYTNFADFTGTGVLTVVPEPAACTLLLTGLCLSGAIFWRRRSRHHEI